MNNPIEDLKKIIHRMKLEITNSQLDQADKDHFEELSNIALEKLEEINGNEQD